MLQKYNKIEDYLQTQLNRLFTDKRQQIQILGYIAVFITYFLTHVINLIEYPSFSTDEMFYVLKAIILNKTGIPSMPKWGGEYAPEFTNPPTLSWIYLILFNFFGPSPLIVRSFMLAIGLLNLLIVFLIGREIAGSEYLWRGYLIAIIAGLLLALDWELVFLSRLGFLDNPMNLFLTIFLYFYLRYLRTEDQNYAWLAGVAAGISLWFKLSVLFVLIGLVFFTLLNRKIDAALRVQAMMVFFAGLYLLWGLMMDPVAFTTDNLFHLTRGMDSNPIGFWGALLLGREWRWSQQITDPIRLLGLFSLLTPLFYLKNRKKFFNESSVLVLCLMSGAIVFFLFTKTLFDYYLAGFASFYAILFAISVFIAFDIVKFLQYKLLKIIGLPRDYSNLLEQGIWLVVLIVVLLALVPKYNRILGVSLENQENLEIISYIQQEVPKGETIVAPMEISPWLNASGYSVYNTWFNYGTPDWVVRDYIETRTPSYLLLHKDYLHVCQDLPYSVIHSFTNYELFMINSKDYCWTNSSLLFSTA
ncbi:MAG: ArnT family glycosyltransferase [Promethearchaeota archaeon]